MNKAMCHEARLYVPLVPSMIMITRSAWQAAARSSTFLRKSCTMESMCSFVKRSSVGACSRASCFSALNPHQVYGRFLHLFHIR